MFPRHGHTRGMDHVRLDATRRKPARQPEAVAAGFDRLIPPAMQQGKQPFGARLQLLARLTLNAGKPTANQPARLAQLDDGNDRAIVVQGDQGPAQVVRLGHRGTPSVRLQRRSCHVLAARPIASFGIARRHDPDARLDAHRRTRGGGSRRRPRRSMGLAHIPEDRLGLALIAEFTAEENAILGEQRKPPFAGGWFAAPTAITDAARQRMEEYDVRPAEPKASTLTLSGGNQQKLVCAREMGRKPVYLIVGQPTRGVDIAASDFIHRRLLALKAAGAAILLVSADLDEIRMLADRILVMEAGRIASALGPAASERELGLLMGASFAH